MGPVWSGDSPTSAFKLKHASGSVSLRFIETTRDRLGITKSLYGCAGCPADPVNWRPLLFAPQKGDKGPGNQTAPGGSLHASRAAGPNGGNHAHPRRVRDEVKEVTP